MAPYTLRRPIRRGHLNISEHYPMQQVFEDVLAIWDFILTEKLHIPLNERNMYSALLVLPETFDSQEIKELLSIVLRDLHFSSAVVHQEGLAAAFGNGLSTGCIVSMGAQVTSVICIEDGVALPTTQKTLPFGGEDISRCLLWTQRHHQTWPQICTDLYTKPIDLLMLNRLKESYCEIKVLQSRGNPTFVHGKAERSLEFLTLLVMGGYVVMSGFKMECMLEKEKSTRTPNSFKHRQCTTLIHKTMSNCLHFTGTQLKAARCYRQLPNDVNVVQGIALLLYKTRLHKGF